MVVVFIFCQFFPIVGDVYELVCLLTGNNTEGICKSNIHIENCINFGHFMLMVNSSVNFVFYMTNIAKFREGFLQVRYDIVCEHVISTTHELYQMPFIIRLIETYITLYIQNYVYFISIYRHFVGAFESVARHRNQLIKPIEHALRIFQRQMGQKRIRQND